MSESGLLRAGGVVVLSGPALKAARDCALIAVKHRKLSGVPSQTYEALACELHAAMAANGHSDGRLPAVSDSVPMEQPTVPCTPAPAMLHRPTTPVTPVTRNGNSSAASRPNPITGSPKPSTGFPPPARPATASRTTVPSSVNC